MGETTLSTLASEAALAFAPLERALASAAGVHELLAVLGWDLPPEVGDLGLSAVAPGDLIDAIHTLIRSTDAEWDDEALSRERLSILIAEMGRVIEAITEAATDIGNILALPVEFVARTHIDTQLLPRLTGWLLASYLVRRHPLLADLFKLAGLIREQSFPADPTNFQTAHSRLWIDPDALGALVSPNRSWALDIYGWGGRTPKIALLLDRIAGVLMALGASPVYSPLSQDVEEAIVGHPVPAAQATPVSSLVLTLLQGIAPDNYRLGIMVAELRASAPGATDTGLALLPFAYGTAEARFPLPTASGRWTLEFDTSADLAGGVALLLRPRREVHVRSGILGGTGAPSTPGNVAFRLTYRVPAGETTQLLALPGGTRFTLQGFAFGGGAEVSPDGSLVASGEAGFEGGRLTIALGAADGFLGSLIPGDSLAVNADIRLAYSQTRGLSFSGSGGLETSLILHASVGPFSIETLFLAFRLADQGVSIEASIDGGGTLGPIGVSVRRLGVGLALDFQRGNLGPFDLGFTFKAPNGLGLAIDAGPITGGGFIGFDEPAGRYTGVIEVDLAGIGVTAIGVLDTKDAAGRPLPPPGFSFLLVISARFEGLQLGFGFALNAVGGLIGIHRAMAIEQLRSGVREGTLDSVMFPEDPVRNMARVLGELGTFFPPANNRFVFGPMAEVGWGTPTLFEMEIGVILELPAPVLIALLGQINVALPTKDADIVALHVAILGVLDFGKKLLSVDASLYNSRIALFSVYGDMALRVAWGEPPNFALAIGGLNPGFQPPPGFPALRRVTVSLGLGDNPRISLQGYLAVTSNSIQFGASAELYAAAWELNVYGWLKFDALVVFDPFFFSFEFSVGFALRWGDATFAGIALSGLISGPSPFHIRGRACISILFIDICVGFDVTIGERQPVLLPEKDPWPDLKEAIADSRNWSSVLALELLPAVRLRDSSGTGPVLVPPMGVITLRQKVLPLNNRLDKFGEFRIPGEARFDVAAVLVGANPVPWEPVQDYFSPGQFEVLSNAEKLSEKSFEPMDAGVRLVADGLGAGRAESVRIAPVNYRTIIVDQPDRRGRPADGPVLSRSAQVALSARGAKAYSALRGTAAAKYTRPRRTAPFAPAGDEYGIADTEVRGLRPEFGTGLSKPLARQRLKAHLARHPEDRGYLQVFPLAELEAIP